VSGDRAEGNVVVPDGRDGQEDPTDVVRRALEASKDPAVFSLLLGRVRRACGELGRKPVLMEVCGSHTWAISHTGIRDLLGGQVDFISGPGCPVCVTSAGEIGRMVELARRPGVITATYGDMLRVPGPSGSLEAIRAEGHRVEVVYSAMDALELAREEPSSQVVFLGVGFETTAPASAVLLKVARERRVPNFSLYSAHKAMPEALRTILSSGGLAVDGLILPGHVSAVTGRRYFDFVGKDCGVAAAISGFEACDILYGVLRLIQKLSARDVRVENCYPRAVSEDGNVRAMAAIREAFEVTVGSWRGLGEIPRSALAVSKEFEDMDAVKRFALPPSREEAEPRGCGCAEVLTGKMRPGDCALFATVCRPSDPVGPCMVSSEGSCRAYYAFGRRSK
jgi:hydrogenase expression/formation protein HypD